MSTLQAQILGNRFSALAREGAASFFAMSRSALVREEGQYACGLLDGDGRLIAQDQGEPSQLAAIQASAEYSLDAFAFNLAEGDVILSGDPYCGGTWGGVLTLLKPVFWEGDLQFLSAVRFAVPDLAGNLPGPLQPDAHEIWQEALRLTPVKLRRAGALQKDVLQYILRNSRARTILDSDLKAADATAKRLGHAIDRIIASYGLGHVKSAVSQRIEYAASRTKSRLAGLTHGTSTSGPITVTVSGDAPLQVDMRGSAGACDGARNLAPSGVTAAVLVQLLAEVIEDVGMCQGILDQIDIVTDAGSIVSPTFPSAVSLGWRETAPHLSEALSMATSTVRAMSPAPPVIIVFPAIGSADIAVPLLVTPGFSPAKSVAGADAAWGGRRLPSAEQTEIEGLLFLERRERTEAGMEVVLRVVGADLEGIALGLDEESAIDGASKRPRSNVLTLPAGTAIRMTYPQREDAHDAEL